MSVFCFVEEASSQESSQSIFIFFSHTCSQIAGSLIYSFAIYSWRHAA